MSKVLLFIAILFFCFYSEDIIAQEISGKDVFKNSISRFYLNNSHFGTDFWVTFHQTWGFYDTEYRVFIISLVNTSVTVELPNGTNRLTKQVQANVPLELSSKRSEINISWSGGESETVTQNGLHVFSNDPILLYVYISSKDYAGEGYLALPVSAWGKEYFSFSYYDYKYPGNGMFHPGGFIVVASEEKTNVTIQLKGAGKGLSKTKGGHNIGDVLTCTLNPGETYSVTGDAKTTGGLFDLSGTRITANKPISVVSFHEFSCITHLCDNFGNYFTEMLLPTSSWGKKYETVMFTRAGTYGDYFRIIGSKNETDWNCKYYDKSNGKLLGNMSSHLKNAGDFFEWYQGGCGNIPSIRGTSVWESEQPFMVMQYAYSHMWDGDLNWQPVMFELTSNDQYISPVVFLAPGNFPSELNLIAIGDTADKSSSLLKSIKYDGESLLSKAPSMVYNNIPGTNLYWVKLNAEVGVHTLEGNTKFAGYLARSRPSSFGWYLGKTLNKTDEFDSLPPEIIKKGSCGDYEIEADEIRNGKPNPNQVDQGISKIVFASDISYNFNFSLLNPENFKPELRVTKQKFTLNVIDRLKSAKAYFAVLDRAGNMAVDSVVYESDNLQISESKICFDKKRILKKYDYPFTITNSSSQNKELGVHFKSTHFKTDISDSILMLNPGEVRNVSVSYLPDDETFGKSDADTIIFSTECNSYSVMLSGAGVSPKIMLTNYDFDTLQIGKKISLEEVNSKGIIIENPGSDSLNVFSINNVKPPFSLSDILQPSLPLVLGPSEKVYIKSLIFSPSDSGQFADTIYISSDALVGDSTFIVTGFGKPKPNSVKELENILELSIIPNPANNKILLLRILNYKENEIGITVSDITGKILKTIPDVFVQDDIYDYPLDVSELQPGFYFIKIESNGKTRSLKFLLNK